MTVVIMQPLQQLSFQTRNQRGARRRSWSCLFQNDCRRSEQETSEGPSRIRQTSKSQINAASLPVARRGPERGLRVGCIIGLNPQKDNTLSLLLIHPEGKRVEAHQPHHFMYGLSTRGAMSR